MAYQQQGSNASPMDDPEILERGPSHYEDNGNGSALKPSVTLNSELFEKLYLSHKGPVAGDLRKIVANPTPLALMGFSVGLTPLSIALMGWRGAGGNAVATVSATIWFGGALLWIAGIPELILGNTFPFIVFMGYGSHFLAFGTTFIPSFDAVAYYTDNNTWGDNNNLTPPFLASYAYYPLSFAILSFILLICSLRTNLVFLLIFICATIGFGMAAGGFFQLAQGSMALGTNLIIGTGACFFAASMLGWYILAAIMFDIMELPIPSLPIVDLSTRIKAKSKKE